MVDQSRWAEKYRPTTFNDVVGQDSIIRKIQGLLNNGGLPHLMFSGVAGVGKTSMAKIISRQVLGQYFNDNYIKLSAGDYSTKDTILQRVVRPMHYLPCGGKYRVFLLDEGDMMSQDAQKQLMTPLEVCGHINKVIMIVNRSDRIIHELQSRLMQFVFSPIPKDVIIIKLTEIAQREGLDINKYEDTINNIAKKSEGDLRGGITELQRRAYSKGDTDDLSAELMKIIGG